ncbi:MAG TPA: hypothetical protein VLG76_08920 [Rhabdochlamydiaceae bacterium]|nr:hypothetical protein [Rhabdochlamydiaceae bacterium]
MSKIRPEDLLNFNERGLIPGPDENEEAFLTRIQKLDHFFSYPTETIDDFLTDGDWGPARTLTHKLFDFSLDWVVAHYSNKNLPFFQGAATWLIDQNGIQIPIIQLKTKFESGGLYKIYHKEEVLAHESIHAARMAFNAPQFEEIFAYMTAKSSLRKCLGPIFQKSWESYVFLIFFIASFFFQIFFPHWQLLFLLPWFYFAFLGMRLTFLRFKLGGCLRKLSKLLFDPSDALPVAVRLTDQEIFLFAKSSADQIQSYIREQSSLRWKLLRQLIN